MAEAGSQRYIEMCCACGAIWIEDRMDPGPTCPSCRHYEAWPLVQNCRYLAVSDRPQLDLTLAELQELLQLCAFTEVRGRSRTSGRVKTVTWGYTHKEGKIAWTLEVEVSRHAGDEVLKCACLRYSVGRKPALEVWIPSRNELFEVMASIVRTIGLHSTTMVPAADVLLCNAPLVE